MEFSCYMNVKDLKKDIDLLSFQIEGFNGWLFAPIITSSQELPAVVKVMREMNLLIKKVEQIDFLNNGEVDYFIWFYRKGQLRLVKQ